MADLARAVRELDATLDAYRDVTGDSDRETVYDALTDLRDAVQSVLDNWSNC